MYLLFYLFYTKFYFIQLDEEKKLKLISICRAAFVVEQQYSSYFNHLLKDEFEIFPLAKFVVFDHFNHLLKYESLKYVHRANLPPHRPPLPICQFEKCQNVLSESSNLFKTREFCLILTFLPDDYIYCCIQYSNPDFLAG